MAKYMFECSDCDWGSTHEDDCDVELISEGTVCLRCPECGDEIIVSTGPVIKNSSKSIKSGRSTSIDEATKLRNFLRKNYTCG
jgi:hypothetical protein